MFCVAVALLVTMWTFTSSRAPVMPTGAPMPSCSSTTKSCGSTWRISRPAGSDTAFAASIARRTSSRVISRLLPATAITPRQLKPLMCGPAIDRCTASISTPAISSASSIAFLIDSTAASRLTITPRRMPRDSATPMPTMSSRAVVDELADDGADLRGADVEAYEIPVLPSHVSSSAPVHGAARAGGHVPGPPAGRTYTRSAKRRSTYSMSGTRACSALARPR